MPKRKRDGQESTENDDSHSNLGPQRKRVEEKLFHAQKVIQRSLKVAKGFERQKLGRRQNTASKEKDEANLARLSAEIEALKTLDLTSTAEAHLHKTLLKDKTIAQSPVLPKRITTNTKSVVDAATANVTARLFNSKPVKDAIAEALPSIRLALGLSPAPRGAKKGAESTQSGKGTGEARTSRILHTSDERRNLPTEVSGNDEDGTGSVRDIEEDFSGSDNSGLDYEGDFEGFDSRIAAPSDDESSNGSEGTDEEKSFPSLPSNGTYKANFDLSLSPTPSPSRSRSPVSKTKAIKKKTPSGPTASKTFLPSLTMGGYVSGSESDAEGLSDADVAPRKNRRGQRARQQIWEKKFGRGAKHLQEGTKSPTNKESKGRDDGWDLKRGARQEVSGKGGRYQPAWKKAKSHEGHRTTSGFASGGNATQVAPRQQKVDTSSKPLHPSWEAAKRAKEKKIETGTFAGKKVVFD